MCVAPSTKAVSIARTSAEKAPALRMRSARTDGTERTVAVLTPVTTREHAVQVGQNVCL